MPETSRPLRLGVWCAVRSEAGLLLSKRSDLNVWALPGGRLDGGEGLANAAAREVEEETGIAAGRLRPIGLYYMAGWRRLNILFAGEVEGGALLGRTDETQDNRFFPLDRMPRVPLNAPVHDAAADRTGSMQVINTPRLRLWALRARFALRFAGNALRGRPEPAFPRFSLTAAALISEPDGGRLLTEPGPVTAAGQLRTLPRIELGGEPAPWEALRAHLRERFGVQGRLRWAGLWQDTAADALELVFTCRAESTGSGEWTVPRLAALDDRDAAYLACPADGPPWLLDAHIAASHDRPLRSVRD